MSVIQHRWAREENRAAIDAAQDISRKLTSDYRDAENNKAADRETYFRLRHEEKRAWEAYLQMKKTVCDEFAREHDWVQKDKGFSLEQLARRSCMSTREEDRRYWSYDHAIWDHPQYFKQGRYPAGIVVHLYDHGMDKPDERLGEIRSMLPAGIAMELLPWSWYYPKRCIAILYTSTKP